jgi:AraC family transcriptional regulator, positive regulator of tynA and feaB
VQTFTTGHVETRRRLDYWSDLASNAITPMRVSAGGQSSFEGRLWTEKLGAIDIARAYSSSVVIRRTPQEISRSADRAFLLSIAEETSYSFRVRGCQLVGRPGDLLLTDSAEPEEIIHSGCTAIVLRMSESLLKAHLPAADDVTGLIVRGDRGAGLMASTMIRSLARNMRHGFDVNVCEHLTAALLHSIAAAYSEAFGVKATATATATAESRRFEITRYVDAHLGDSDLTVQNTALAFGVSDRYVRMLFESTGEPLSSYIQRRRLEESARQLRDPLWRARTVSEIAFNWGFNSLGSYDRAFKVRFDRTPSEYRRHWERGEPTD